jgi:hypothetical protein
MKNIIKILLILTSLIISGCEKGVIVEKETYDNQIKKCESNSGVESIKYFDSSDHPYWKIETTCNNGAFFKEYYSDKK